MKTIIFFCCLVLAGIPNVKAQEFKMHSNGFIYSDSAMRGLHHIVDSLHLKYRICDPDKVYYSSYQGRANYMSFKGKKELLKKIKNKIDKGVAYNDLMEEFGSAVDQKEEDIPVIRCINHEDGKAEVEFRSFSPHNNSMPYALHPDGRYISNEHLKGKYLYRSGTYEYEGKYYLDVYYFLTDLSSRKLIKKYSQLVQYSECMVDTNAQIFLAGDKGYHEYIRGQDNTAKKDSVSAFYALLEYPGKPVYPKNEGDSVKEYYRLDSIWEVRREAHIDSQFRHNAKYIKSLQAAVNSLKIEKRGDDEVEYYAARYLSKADALFLKRHRIVIGGCSMDQSPRMHALAIAELAGETVNWSIFLRAHLDIMNDNFSRVSDGSYAWGRRKTYIKELEAMDINVLDLILGISMRVSNPGQNHYYGAINRLGRALSESADSISFEKRTLEMLKDTTLDDHNRIMVYFLYANYIYYHDKESAIQHLNVLRMMKNEFPDYLSKAIDSLKNPD